LNRKEQAGINFLQGISAAQIRILKQRGINSLFEIIKEGPVHLSEITGMGIKDTSIICSKARITLAGLGNVVPFIQPVNEVANNTSIERISTGCDALDGMLGGGIETHAITELVGESGAGKTQLCHTISVTAQIQAKQDIQSKNKVLYIDTEGTFRDKRIAQIAAERGAVSEEVRKNIKLASVYNTAELGYLTDNLETTINDNGIKLIVVDSLIAHFRAEYTKTSNLPDRQRAIHKTMTALLTFARVYGVAIVVTNHVQDVSVGWNNTALLRRTQAIPTGGNVMAHDSTYRIFLRRTDLWSGTALILSSPYHPTGEIRFDITERGIDNAERSY
jgi:DNA repair protein RadA